tara:strand:- start:16711 stop:17856 length:1146 start_codon:yes stop_codon:yes gene_type:complete
MKINNLEILKNPICKFKILNNKHLLKDGNIDVICSVFFKLKKYYKHFSIYVNGLSRLINYIEETKHNYKFILFIDQNIKNDKMVMNILYKSKKTIPILFTCSKYMKNNYHLDLFGTLIRYFPLFNFENNFTNRVVVIDIELSPYYLKLFKILEKINHESIVFVGGFFEYLINNNKDDIYILGGLISSKNKYNKNIILEFIKNAHKIKYKSNNELRLSTWEYGIDEIFINRKFKREIDFGLLKRYKMSYFFYQSKEYLLDEKRIKNSYKILKKIIDKIREVEPNAISNNPTIQEMLDFIDKNTFSVKEKTKINDIISIYYNKAITYALKNNTEFIEKKFMKFIKKYLENIISCYMIIHFDKNHNIKLINYYDVIYDSSYNEK